MDNSLSSAPWSIERGPAPADELLRIGQRVLRFADISGYRCVSDDEVNVAGQILAAAVFIGAGVLCATAVVLELLTTPLIGAAALFFAVGLSAMADTFGDHHIVVHRVYVQLRDGRVETFASPLLEECLDLAAVLGSHAGKGSQKGATGTT